ncbi:MAG: histone family protein [Candidatus Woesearchaeota archaeon]
MDNKKDIPLAAMERLLKKSGAERVAEDAKDALRDALVEYALKIGQDATKYSNHAGRKTVKAEDIKLAITK